MAAFWHTWGVVTGRDGKLYRHPLSQSLDLPGQNSFLSGGGKGFWMLYPDRAACPVWEYETPRERFLAEVCHWGYDFHQRLRWPDHRSPKRVKAGDRMKIRFVMTAYTGREAERIFLAAPLHPKQMTAEYRGGKRFLRNNVPNNVAYPVCDPAGTDFTRLHSVREPYVGWQFRGKYVVDDTVGYNDSYSLRLDGPAERLGEFYHHMIDGYAKEYLCTLWLRTSGTAGAGPIVRLKYSYAADPCDEIKTNLKGDNDWQNISFVTTVPAITFETYDSNSIVLRLDGPGTVWMDDFSVRPIEAREPVTEKLPPRARLVRTPAKSRRFW